MTVPHVEEDGLDALGLDRLAMHDRHPEGALVNGGRPLQVGDGDADVIDQLEHCGLSLWSRNRLALGLVGGTSGEDPGGVGVASFLVLALGYRLELLGALPGHD